MGALNDAMDLSLSGIERLTQIMIHVLDRQQDFDLRLRRIETALEQMQEDKK